MLSAWMSRQRHRPAVQTAVVLAALATAAVFLACAYQKAGRPGGYDVHCYLATARAVRAGDNPYLVDLPIPYNYPLFACTAAVPLTFLPEWFLHGAWFVAALAAWAVAAYQLVRRLPPEAGACWDSKLLLPLLGSSLLLIGAVQNHLLNGQTDALILLLCVLFWFDWREGRGGRAAFWLGLGVSIKLVPALFLVPLLLRRSWGVVALTCLWVVVLCVALPALFLGADVLDAYAYYGRHFLLAELQTSVHSDLFPHIYTLHGALSWLAPACRTSLTAKAAAALAVVGPLGEAAWRGDGGSPWRRFALLEAHLAGILLLSPLSEPHHLTLLLPCAWLTALRWLAAPRRRLWTELLELAPYALFPLWKVVGGPLEFVAVAWLFVAALCRAAEFGAEKAAAARIPALRNAA